MLEVTTFWSIGLDGEAMIPGIRSIQSNTYGLKNTHQTIFLLKQQEETTRVESNKMRTGEDILKKSFLGASRVIQWLEICLAKQGTWV